MKLSTRLNEIVLTVPIDSKFIADIGADHGFVSLELLNSRKDIKIFATDNKIGPFSRLKNNLENQKNVILSLSNGLDELPLDVDTVIISGMGGDLIKTIIEKGKEHFSHINYFLLSPHNEESHVRRFLYDSGYHLINEKFLKDDNIYYSILLFAKGEDKLSYLDEIYGPILRKEKCDVFIEYINKEIKRNEELLTIKSLDSKRIFEIKEYIKELKNL